MRVALKCAVQFSQGMDATTGQLVGYLPGASIPDETWQAWDAETLSNRLAGGFVKWDTVKDDDAPTGEGDGDPEHMNKEQLVEYAQRVYGTKLDQRTGEKNMREQIALLAERARLVAIAEQEKAAAEAAANASKGSTGAK